MANHCLHVCQGTTAAQAAVEGRCQPQLRARFACPASGRWVCLPAPCRLRRASHIWRSKQHQGPPELAAGSVGLTSFATISTATSSASARPETGRQVPKTRHRRRALICPAAVAYPGHDPTPSCPGCCWLPGAGDLAGFYLPAGHARAAEHVAGALQAAISSASCSNRTRLSPSSTRTIPRSHPPPVPASATGVSARRPSAPCASAWSTRPGPWPDRPARCPVSPCLTSTSFWPSASACMPRGPSGSPGTAWPSG